MKNSRGKFPPQNNVLILYHSYSTLKSYKFVHSYLLWQHRYTALKEIVQWDYPPNREGKASCY